MNSVARIAGVVIFYNPDPAFIDNIKSYADDVEVVYVVDNSDVALMGINEIFAAFPKVIYIWNAGNLGIATALNIGIGHAARAGFDYVLTMDQDSCATPGMVRTLISCLGMFAGDTIGIVSPYHRISDSATPPPEEWQDVDAVMASGNMLSMSAFKRTGTFRDEYFIDYVDHEYCFRLRQNGYRIIRSNQAVLKHRLGAITWHLLLWKRVKIGNHPPVRRYYSYRNRFHLHSRYRTAFPGYFRFFYREIVQELCGLLLFEQQKLAKLKMMWRGYCDYRNGVFGKFQDVHAAAHGEGESCHRS